jgi:hypothetical protein
MTIGIRLQSFALKLWHCLTLTLSIQMFKAFVKGLPMSSFFNMVKIYLFFAKFFVCQTFLTKKTCATFYILKCGFSISKRRMCFYFD